ncbi:MAG: hypothetical protein ACRC7R_06015 [Sarcina sp.]
MNRKYISTIAISLTIMSMALVGCNSSDEDISKVLKDTTVTKSNEESNKKEVKNNLSLEQLDKLKSDDMLQEGINKEKLKEAMDDFADSIYNTSNEAKAKAGEIKDQVNNISYSMKKLNNNKNKAENSLSNILDSIQSEGILGKISNISGKGKQVTNNINDVSNKIQKASNNIDDFKNSTGNILELGKHNVQRLKPVLKEDFMSIRNDFKEELHKNIKDVRNDIRQDVQKNINDIGTDVKAHMKDNQTKLFSKINETQNSINNFLGQMIKSKKN